MSDRTTSEFGPAHDWGRIRMWDGSQQRAFEELCFQLRDPAPEGWQTIKTAAPDGGVEWYDQGPDGRVHGFQAKFVDSIDKLLQLARESAKTVGTNRTRRNVVKLTFLAPIDLPDPAGTTRTGKVREGARQRWSKAVARWRDELAGLDDVEIDLVGSGELLERLTQPGNEGRQWFFFQQVALGPDWCRTQFTQTERLASERYTPDRHLPLPLTGTVDGLLLNARFRRLVDDHVTAAYKAVHESEAKWRWWLGHHSDTAAALLDLSTSSTPAPQRLPDLTARLDDAATAMTSLHDGLLPVEISQGVAAIAAVEIANTAREALQRFLSSARDLTDHLKQSADAARQEDVPADGVADQNPMPDQPNTPRMNPIAALEDLAARDGAVQDALAATTRLIRFLSSDHSHAAETKAWLLLGDPGQGKTHLLLDAVRRTIAANGAAVAVLGERLSGDDPLTEIARALGLGDLPHTTFLQALDAAGAATGMRFLLVIDALNDCEQPSRWRTQLHAVLAQLHDFDHVAVVFSCRTTMRDVVLPTDLQTIKIPVTHHPGFRGREVEGLEKYLSDIPHALPRTPLLQSAFGNPLFVKLYAETLRTRAATSATPVTVGGAHRSEVFATFLDSRAKDVCFELGLDPVTRPVHNAVRALADRMAETGYEVLPREEARAIVDPFASNATTWPKTMLGQLISRGILATDRFVRRGAEPDAGIAFPYQAFSDDLIVRAALEHHREDLDRLADQLPLPEHSALRQWLEAASPNLEEAATILLPESVGVELVDALGTTDRGDSHEDNNRNYGLFRALVRTLPLRAGSSVTDRTRELLNEAINYGLTHDVYNAVVAVSTEPDHRLNAHNLHRTLTALDSNVRDAAWGTYTYSAYQEIGPVQRLLRWAEQTPTPSRLLPDRRPSHPALTVRRAGTRPTPTAPPRDLSPEVVDLAATVLTWTLTSSHRFLRDRATKALVQLLLGYPQLLSTLLDKFLGKDAPRVDDQYLFARVLVVVEGVILRTGHAQPDAVLALTRQVSDLVHADTDSPVHVSRGVLLCDAARGIIAAARRLGVITDTHLARTAHPHAAPMPGEVPSEEELERRFPRDRRGTDTSWGSLWSSLDHELGDFGRYEVGYHTSHFSRLPIDRPRPSEEKAERDRRPPALDTAHVAAFHAALPVNVRDVLATPTSVLRLLDEDWLARKLLDDDQYRLLHACPVPPPLDEQLFAEEQDAEWASRWILMRVAELGWSPRLFGAFDGYRPNNYSHDSHRPERMGKKYQWIALHDLLERLANHYHVAHKWDPDPHPYRGAWELNVRDIDPSLRPTTHPLPDQDENPDADDDPALGHTFPPADTTAFWAPPTPALPARDDIEAWVHQGSTIPTLRNMSVRTDSAGTVWLVLAEFAKDTPDGRGFAGPVGQAEQWHHIDTWLVTKNQTPHVVDFMRTRSLIPRWMPEEPGPNGIYLSEYPDAAPAQDLDIDDGYSHHLRHSDPHDQQPSPRPPRTDLLAELLGEDSTVNTLDDLATLWSNVDIVDETSWTAEPHDHNRPGNGTGTPFRAIPATVFYSWSGNEADCSINEAVSAHLPTNRLLRDSGLVRHPDRPDWYDFAGTLAITYRWGLRPTGEVRTLLVRQDWLTQRLNELGYDLIVGLIGELQTTREVPAAWRQFSQCAQLQANGALDAIHTLTTVRHRRK